jgi:hypothetical protein
MTKTQRLPGRLVGRNLDGRRTPDDVVQDILEVGRWSGSASNRQFGEIIVVRKRDTLQALAGLGGYVGHLRNAALGMLLVMLAAWAHGVGSSNPASPPRRGSRKPLNELVHEEQYRA